jgi:hypothetical protein
MRSLAHRLTRSLVPMAVLACLAMAAPARAQAPVDDAKAEAQARMKEGARLLDAQPGEALRLFREAYRLVKNPNYQYNIGTAAQAVGRDAEALEAFQYFLANQRGVSEEYVNDARKQVASLLGRVALATLRCPQADAEILIDGRDVGRTPLKEPVVLDQGEHRFIVRKKGYENFERLVSVRSGEKITVDAELRPVPVVAPTVSAPVAAVLVAPAPAPERDEAPAIYKRWWFWTAVGAVVITGVVVGLAASSQQSGGPACPGGSRCVPE